MTNPQINPKALLAIYPETIWQTAALLLVIKDICISCHLKFPDIEDLVIKFRTDQLEPQEIQRLIKVAEELQESTGIQLANHTIYATELFDFLNSRGST